MQTQARPNDTRPGPRLPVTLLAEIGMAAGVVLTVLGIIEVGGLLILFFGLLLTFVASIPLILNPESGTRGFDRELRRLMKEG